MEQKKRIIRITRTAVFLALLIVLQAATAPLGNTLLTGSVVNFLLITSVMLCGPASGFTVAVLSPVLARFLGIGPLWALIPFIIAGNITICAVWYLVAGRGGRPGIFRNAWQWREALRQRRRYCMEGLPVRGALPSCTGGTAGIAGFRDVFPSSVYYGHGGRDGGSSSASGSEESGKRNIKNSTARGMIFPGSAVSVRKSR